MPAIRINPATVAAVGTFLTGVTFVTERFSSPAMREPFALLGAHGQLIWGIAYVVGGVLLAVMGAGVPMPMAFRVILCIVGCFIWGIFGASSAYVSLFGPEAHRWGSGWAVFSLTMVICLVAACGDTVTSRVAHPVKRP